MDLAPPHVRALSWLSACTLAALAIVALRQALPAPNQAEAPSIAFVTLELPRPTTLAPQAMDDSGSDVQATSAGDGVELTLWTYGARGEIVFSDIEQYERCAEARRRHHEASDCPGADETVPLIFYPDARRGIRIDPPRYRRRR